MNGVYEHLFEHPPDRLATIRKAEAAKGYKEIMQQRRKRKITSSSEAKKEEAYQGSDLKRPGHKGLKRTEGMTLRKRVGRVV